jgi:hypothetical protein
MGQHVNLSASKSVPQRKCWPEFELFLRIPLLILVSVWGKWGEWMWRSLSLCANTHHVPNCNDVCMHCCQTQYLKEIFLRVSLLWNLPHLVVTFSWSTFPSTWFEFWVQVWLFIVHESKLFSFVNAKSTSCINLGGHDLVWFELMGSIVRMQDSDWWMVVARRGAQESIIAQIWVHCKKNWLATLYSQDFRNRLLSL